MSNIELKQILLLHPQKFFCEALSTFAELEDISVYFLNSYEQFAYLINDLRPEFILAKDSFVQENSDGFKQELSQAEFKDYRLIVLGESAEFESIQGAIDPQDFLLELKQRLASHLESH